MRRVLLTGGSGFIGSHTCLALLERNYEVWVIDSLINSSIKSLERVRNLTNKRDNLRFFKGDLRDIEFIREIFLKASNSDIPISGVIHFAGLKSIAESVLDPIKYWSNNVLA